LRMFRRGRCGRVFRPSRHASFCVKRPGWPRARRQRIRVDGMIIEETSDVTEAESGVDVGYQEVLKRIPHRYPFLLIDRGENWIKNKSMVGIKNVTFNEPFFNGHFPENPVMPGVLIIEAL